MQAQLSSVGIIDLSTDTITSINGASGSWSPGQLITDFPQTFFLEKNSLGESRLCALRIDGEPFAMTALNNSVPYVPVIDNYDIMYPGNFSTHPIHRPK